MKLQVAALACLFAAKSLATPLAGTKHPLVTRQALPWIVGDLTGVDGNDPDYANGPPGPDLNINRSHIGSVPYGVAIHACKNPGQVALTFDDGPTEYTRSVAIQLSNANFTGTFFMVGFYAYKKLYDNSTQYPELIRSLHAAGHQIGSHTFTHLNMNKLSEAERRRQMLNNEKALERVLGFAPTYMRPPFGRCSNECLEELKDLGYHVILWSIDTKDYLNNTDLTYYQTNENFNRDLDAGGTIALLHDTKIFTADKVIPHIIAELKHRGLRGVSVGECLGDDRANWYRREHK
ncbi:chitin deacetylase [Pestalotiopsis sp. 9143b]|nr:chitin deacetylase [Pestalotiopsis sp. 9143b]